MKTNEVPMATVVLGQIDLHGTLVTADALHTVKATAEFIRQGGGEFILPVKENRKTLFKRPCMSRGYGSRPYQLAD